MNFSFTDSTAPLASIALALYEDGQIGLGVPDECKTLNVADTVQMIAACAAQSVTSSMPSKTWVERRDVVHSLIRLFARSMKAAPAAAVWAKPSEELPVSLTGIMFVLKGSDEIKYGFFDGEKHVFVYQFEEISITKVAYWMYRPVAPTENGDQN